MKKQTINFIMTIVAMALITVLTSIFILSCSISKETSTARYKQELNEGKLTQAEYKSLMAAQRDLIKIRNLK